MPERIPESFFSVLRAEGTLEHLPANCTVIAQGEPVEHYYVIASGRVRVFMLTSAGREITLEILAAGRVFGDRSLFSDRNHYVTVETVEETELIVCRMEQFMQRCHQSEELMMYLFRQMAETCQYLTRQLARLTCYDSRQKLADFLLEEQMLRESDTVTCTHEEIATAVCLNRVTVSRVLSDFRARGWIQLSYGKIRILKMDGLRTVLPAASNRIMEG